MTIRIPLEAVASSNLAALGYDEPKRILAVQFKSSGHIYHYAGIPPGTMLAFYQAESRGAFFAKEIKGKYQAEMMTGTCHDCGDVGWIGDTCADCGCSAYTAVPRKEKKRA